jgi:methyl-accepting chemotaxis protein
MNRLDDLSIRTKVMAAFGLVLMVALALGAFSIERLAVVNDRAAEIRDNWLVATGALGNFAKHAMRYRQIEAAHILAKSDVDKDKEETTLGTVLNDVQQSWKVYEPTITTTEERQLVAEIRPLLQQYLEMDKALRVLSRQHEDDSATNLYRGEMRQTFNKFFFDKLQPLIDLNIAGGRMAANDAEETYFMARRWIIIALMLAAGFCFAAGLVIVAGVSTPIQAMTEAMSRLAAHDLTAEITGLGRRDEIGRMAKAVQVFKDSMIETDRLTTLQQAEQAKKEDRRLKVEGYIAGFDAKARGALETLASASTELRSTAESMSAIAEEASRQSTAVSAASEQASQNVQTVAVATEEMAASVSEISRQVAQSSEIAGRAVGQAVETNRTIQGLSAAAQKIGEVVELINDIASQTNLLALNATIEASRAGDAGKGFAVVASEVKNLASQTAKATEDIAAQVAAMQHATKNAVDAIGAINQTIAEISQIATAIATAVEEQTAATREITRNTQEAARGTEEVSRNIVGVSRAAQETGAASTQVLGASETLSRQSEGLRQDVGGFLADIRSA